MRLADYTVTVHTRIADRSLHYGKTTLPPRRRGGQGGWEQRGSACVSCRGARRDPPAAACAAWRRPPPPHADAQGGHAPIAESEPFGDVVIAAADDAPGVATPSAADPLSFRRPGVRDQTLRQLRRGRYPVEDELDLHGMSQSSARDELAEFIAASRRAGLRCVRMVHGKGLPLGRSRSRAQGCREYMAQAPCRRPRVHLGTSHRRRHRRGVRAAALRPARMRPRASQARPASPGRSRRMPARRGRRSRAAPTSRTAPSRA